MISRSAFLHGAFLLVLCASCAASEPPRQRAMRPYFAGWPDILCNLVPTLPPDNPAVAIGHPYIPSTEPRLTSAPIDVVVDTPILGCSAGDKLAAPMRFPGMPLKGEASGKLLVFLARNRPEGMPDTRQRDFVCELGTGDVPDLTSCLRQVASARAKAKRYEEFMPHFKKAVLGYLGTQSVVLRAALVKSLGGATVYAIVRGATQEEAQAVLEFSRSLPPREAMWLGVILAEETGVDVTEDVVRWDAFIDSGCDPDVWRARGGVLPKDYSLPQAERETLSDQAWRAVVRGTPKMARAIRAEVLFETLPAEKSSMTAGLVQLGYLKHPQVLPRLASVLRTVIFDTDLVDCIAGYNSDEAVGILRECSDAVEVRWDKNTKGIVLCVLRDAIAGMKTSTGVGLGSEEATGRRTTEGAVNR